MSNINAAIWQAWFEDMMNSVFMCYTLPMLKCPICNEELTREGKTVQCINHHSFDVAKQGYINLSTRQKKNQGDNAAMVKARSEFLEKGYYSFLRDEICSIIQKYNCSTLIDAGCGQGYYTRKFSEYVNECIGIDLSKDAVLYAAKKDKKPLYLVSSIFEMPVISRWADCVTSIFVPAAAEEIHRVLKENGTWITVGPGPMHVYELKEVMYEKHYKNELPVTEYKGYEKLSSQIIAQKHLVSDCMALLDMTPYRYKSSKEAVERVENMKETEITFEFVITVWRKV